MTYTIKKLLATLLLLPCLLITNGQDLIVSSCLIDNIIECNDLVIKGNKIVYSPLLNNTNNNISIDSIYKIQFFPDKEIIFYKYNKLDTIACSIYSIEQSSIYYKTPDSKKMQTISTSNVLAYTTTKNDQSKSDASWIKLKNNNRSKASYTETPHTLIKDDNSEFSCQVKSITSDFIVYSTNDKSTLSLDTLSKDSIKEIFFSGSTDHNKTAHNATSSLYKSKKQNHFTTSKGRTNKPFQINFSGARSNLLIISDYTTEYTKDYSSKLKKGFALTAGFDYYFAPHVGIGLSANIARHKNTSSNPINIDGNTINYLSDNITHLFCGIDFAIKSSTFNIIKNEINIIPGIFYYTNTRNYDRSIINYSGQNFGIEIHERPGFSLREDGLFLYFDFCVFMGYLNYKQIDGVITSLDEQSNESRLDVGIGVKF